MHHATDSRFRGPVFIEHRNTTVAGIVNGSCQRRLEILAAHDQLPNALTVKAMAASKLEMGRRQLDDVDVVGFEHVNNLEAGLTLRIVEYSNGRPGDERDKDRG